MISTEDIRSYRCPVWDELPDLDLYMDQVMSVLEKKLHIFIEEDPARAITPTMINNYVKQKMVPPPKNKRYNKRHIASFFIITLLKQVMSMSQISRVIDCVMTEENPEKGYNRFCDIFEASLLTVFFGEEKADTEKNDTDVMLSSICLAFANKLYAELLLSKLAPEEPKKESKDAQKEKKKKKANEEKE